MKDIVYNHMLEVRDITVGLYDEIKDINNVTQKQLYSEFVHRAQDYYMDMAVILDKLGMCKSEAMVVYRDFQYTVDRIKSAENVENIYNPYL